MAKTAFGLLASLVSATLCMSQRTQHSTTLQFARLHDTYTHADITVAVHQDSSWSVSVFASMLHCTLMIFGVAHQCSWAGEVRQSEKVFLSLPTFQSRVEMANMHYSVQPGALPSSQYSIYCPQNQSVTCIPFNQGCHWNMHVRNICEERQHCYSIPSKLYDLQGVVDVCNSKCTT